MPDGRDLVVDVKTPLDAYLEAVEAATDELRAVALRRHAQAVAERVRQLSSKNYWNQFEKSPDFVILFIPGRSVPVGGARRAAVADRGCDPAERDHRHAVELRRDAQDSRLRMAAERCSRRTPQRSGRSPRSCTSASRSSASTSPSSAASSATSVETFNSAVGSLERQVLPGARKFTELGVRPEREIESLDPVRQAGARTAWSEDPVHGRARAAGEQSDGRRAATEGVARRFAGEPRRAAGLDALSP